MSCAFLLHGDERPHRAFLLTPIVVTAIMAFDSRDFLGPLPPPSLSFRWFTTFFSDSYFLTGLSTSVQLALASVAISLGAGVATAFAIDRTHFRGKDALVSFFLSPLVVPPVVIGFALLLFLSHMGCSTALRGCCAATSSSPCPTRSARRSPGISGIDRSLTEAALILGADGAAGVLGRHASRSPAPASSAARFSPSRCRWTTSRCRSC